MQFKIRIIVLRQSRNFDPADEGRNVPSDSDISESRVFNRSSFRKGGVNVTAIVGIPADDPQTQHLILMRFHGYYKLKDQRSAKTLYTKLIRMCTPDGDFDNGHSAANTTGAYFLRTPNCGDVDYKFKEIFHNFPYLFKFNEAKSYAALILNDLNNGKYNDILPNKQTFSIRPGAVAAEMDRLSMARTAIETETENEKQSNGMEKTVKFLFKMRFLLSTCSNRTVRWAIVCRPYGFQLEHFSSDAQCLENRICLEVMDTHDNPGRGGGNFYMYCVQTCNDDRLSEQVNNHLDVKDNREKVRIGNSEGKDMERRACNDDRLSEQANNHLDVKDNREKVRIGNSEPSFDPARYSRQELCDAMKESKRVCKDMERREAARLEEIACRIFESEDEE